MRFAGLLKQSLTDYPGKIAAVLFSRGCNLRCPFCHNAHLLVKPGRTTIADEIETPELIPFLEERRGFLDAVVFSGGEPTMNPELPEVIRQVKEIGYLIKLDTNGSNPMMLEKLLHQELLDYVAMDIKAPLEYEKYLQASGRLSVEDFFNIRSSINLLQTAAIMVEFRTTVVPVWHRPEDIVEIACYIKGARLYSLQQFNPRTTLDLELSRVKPYSKAELEKIAADCQPYVQKVRVCNV
ncbi:MAG TPA: anaerobic ribonucleoside-triphosphate reductase activating protein [Syntrophomonas sp.]|jgi:pyruvate formate lyase activating enzyme|nr:anaerobic ribonucleoside-triphosphate reductase activating protein [Syntrophomonas sp.]